MDLLSLQITSPYILVLVSFVLGIYAAVISYIAFKPTKTMALAISLLPTIVCAALLAINGSLGTGIAILGVFGLVRFRSLPGKSTDIVNVFYAMAVGLMVSTGYVLSSAVLTLMIGLLILAASKCAGKWIQDVYEVRIMVPEEHVDIQLYQNLISQYGRDSQLVRLKTSHMGTLYELLFTMVPKPDMNLSEMMEEIRIHNGNLNVTYCKAEQSESSL